MKVVNLILSVFTVLTVLSLVNGHCSSSKSSSCRSSSSSEEHIDYECGVRYERYYRDWVPTENGLYVGRTPKDRSAFVGFASWQGNDLTAGTLMLYDPGVQVPDNNGNGVYVNSIDAMWYIRRKSYHEYDWVKSQDGDTVPFAIDYGTNSSGWITYVGRIVRKDTMIDGEPTDTYIIGFVPLYEKKMYYIDENDELAETSEYEVLTCRSFWYEDPRMPPEVPRTHMCEIPPNVDGYPGGSGDDSDGSDSSDGSDGSISSSDPSTLYGCINNWIEYNNDESPVTDGVSAGRHSSGNFAYVGKGSLGGPWRPGRIMTTGDDAGFYTLSDGVEVKLTNGSFYLTQNSSYSYTWVPFSGQVPANAVNVRNPVGNAYSTVARVEIDGFTRIGRVVGSNAEFPNDDGTAATILSNFEVLTCITRPMYICNSTWNAYNLDDGPSSDGFRVGNLSNTPVFIGRAKYKSSRDWDYGIGRIETSPTPGAYFYDPLLAKEVFDNTTAEYLVRNAGDSYYWSASSNGLGVINAIPVMSAESGGVFQIGMVRIDGNTFIGRVSVGEGLFYIDADGNSRFSNSYSVLTCFSPDPTNGVAVTQPAVACPVMKQWNVVTQSCMCMRAYRDVFVPENATWNEETCTYDV